MKEPRFEIFESFETLNDDQRAQWDKFVLEANGTIYMSYDWCYTWWLYYGRPRRLLIYQFWDGNEMVGIVPLLVDKVFLLFSSPRIARLLGSDFCPKLVDPPINASWAEPVMKLLLADLLEGNKCDLVSFGPFSGPGPASPAVRNAAAEKPVAYKLLRQDATALHTAFDLPASLEDYDQSLSASLRKALRRTRKRCVEEFKLQADKLEDLPQAEGEFQRFKTMHDRQWNSQGLRGHFASWPEAEQFNLALIRSHWRLGRVRLFRIIADDRVIAYNYAYVFGHHCYWILPARELGEPWDRLGLGAVGLTKMIEMLILERVQTIEAGIGHYDYKLRYGGKEYNAQTVVIARNRPSAVMRARLLVLASKVLDLAYHEMIYRRLASKWALFRRPLWRLWVRTRT